MPGWIKLHRSVRDKAFYSKPDYYLLWSELLFSAAYEEKEVFVNGSTMLMKPGQFITSRLKLSHQTGIQQHKVDRILNYFKTEQQIEQVNLHSCRLISVVNWEKYQMFEQQSEHGMSRECAADEQPMSTTKNSKNTKKLKKEKNRESVFSESSLSNWDNFRSALPDWTEEKAKIYFNKFHDDEELHPGRRYGNWALAARKWAEKDEKNGNGPLPMYGTARKESQEEKITRMAERLRK